MPEQPSFIRSLKRLTKPKLGIALAPRPGAAASYAAHPLEVAGMDEGGKVEYATTAPYLPSDAAPPSADAGQLPLMNDPHLPAFGIKKLPRTFLGLTGPDWLQVGLAAGTGAGAGAAARSDRSAGNGLAGIRARINENPYQGSSQSGYQPVSIRSASPLGYADGGAVGDDTDHNGPSHIEQANQGGISPQSAAMMNPAGSAIAPVIGQAMALKDMFSHGGYVHMAGGGMPPQQAQQPQQPQQQGEDPQKQQVFMMTVAAIEGKIQDPSQVKMVVQAFLQIWGPQALQELVQHLGAQGQTPQQAPQQMPQQQPQQPPQAPQGIAGVPPQQAGPGGMADGGSVWDFLNPEANAQQAILSRVPPNPNGSGGGAHPSFSLNSILDLLNPDANMQQAAAESAKSMRPISVPSGRGVIGLLNPEANMQQAAQGSRYARGGAIYGPGDGMSDQVPAQHSQSGQPIMLSNDEYVVPADAVAMLGNGSSHAGAKKLDAGIAKLRKQKYGRAQQPAPLAPNANPILGQ